MAAALGISSRSKPITWVRGYVDAISYPQRPVPHPTSNTAPPFLSCASTGQTGCPVRAVEKYSVDNPAAAALAGPLGANRGHQPGSVAHPRPDRPLASVENGVPTS